ncbi:hypothetical protein [Promicromonospora sp. NPDC050262]
MSDPQVTRVTCGLAENQVRRLDESIPVEWFTWPEEPPAAT